MNPLVDEATAAARNMTLRGERLANSCRYPTRRRLPVDAAFSMDFEALSPAFWLSHRPNLDQDLGSLLRTDSLNDMR
jgi:hypothetical protein